MDIPTLRKVIELYLRGFGYQEISKQQASRLIDSMLKYIHSGNHGGNR